MNKRLGDDVSFLAELRDLEYLDLTDTDVTDHSIPLLARLKKLRYLHLTHTLVTDEGAQRLQRPLPACKIIR